jgi:dCMP deaminase
MSLTRLIAGLRAQQGTPVVSSCSDDRDYVRMAYRVARMSEDPQTQVGCLVPDYDGRPKIIASNVFPRGISWRGRIEGELKNRHILHAEIVLLAEACNKNFNLSGHTVYINWVPCNHCANALVQVGIKALVTHRDRHERTPEKWKDAYQAGLDILHEAGVQVRWVEGKLGGVKNLADGILWEP